VPDGTDSVCTYAHQETAVPEVGRMTRPSTIHDFYGFPQVLYRIEHLASGFPRSPRNRYRR
jgi:4,5-DOPA dioxygenase extradiol